MEEKDMLFSILGTGWSFPPEFSNAAKGVKMVSDEDDIKQSLQILLSTSLGERVMRPDFGCDLHDYVFETINAPVKTEIKNLVQNAILYHEPRIIVDAIDLMADENEGIINISIEYSVISSNSRSNYVYPFYIKEGTNLNV